MMTKIRNILSLWKREEISECVLCHYIATWQAKVRRFLLLGINSIQWVSNLLLCNAT